MERRQATNVLGWLVDRLASPEVAQPSLAVRVAAGLPLPLVALLLQPGLQSPTRTLTWFLFFPAVFLSGWIGGFAGGVSAACFSVALVYGVVLEFNAAGLVHPHDLFTQAGVFLVAGVLVSLVHEGLRQQARSLASARGAAERDAKALAQAKARIEVAFDEVQRSERLLLQLFEQAPLGIALTDQASGRVLATNRQFDAITGWSSEQWLGRAWTDATLPEDRAAAAQELARLHAGELARLALQQRVLRPDGTHVWCRTSVARVEAPDTAPKDLVMIEDVTARHLVEQQVQDTLARLRAAVQVGKLGVWHLDLVDDTMTWDTRVCDFYAVPEDLRRTGISYEFWRSRLHPDDRARLEEASRRLRETGEPQENVFRVVLPDGRVRWLQSVAMGERDAAGRPWRVIGVNRDVTGHHEATVTKAAAG